MPSSAIPRAEPTGAEKFRAIAGNLPLCQASVRAAWENRQFTLAFQPLLRATDGFVVGFESLLRWTHPTQGEQSPLAFVPIMERTNLIQDVGEWVLRESLEHAARWEARGAPPLRVAVNVAPMQVQSPDFPNRVSRALNVAGVSADRLTLEISQETLLGRAELTGHQLARLAMLGVEIHLDDFASGPSSLNNLQALALTGIKLDRRFIAPFVAAGGSRNDLRTIVGLARQLGLKTVAEGVQTDAEVAAVWELGIDEVQGHLFCPALPAPAFENYLRAQSAHTGFRGD